MRCDTTAPAPKPSVQTRFVLEAVAAGASKEEELWTRMFEKLDAMSHGLDEMEEVQQQFGQADLAAVVAEQAGKERDILSRRVA